MLTIKNNSTESVVHHEQDYSSSNANLNNMADLRKQIQTKATLASNEIGKAQQAMNQRNAQSLQDLSTKNIQQEDHASTSSFLRELSSNVQHVKENELQQTDYQNNVESQVRTRQNLYSQISDIELLCRLLQQQIATQESASLKTKAYAVKENEVSQKLSESEQSAINLVVADVRRQNDVLKEQINQLADQEQKHVQVEHNLDEECSKSVLKLQNLQTQITEERDLLFEQLTELRQQSMKAQTTSEMQIDQLGQVEAETARLEVIVEQLRTNSLTGTVEGYNKQFEELLGLITGNNEDLKKIREEGSRAEASFYEMQATNRGLELKLNGLKCEKQMKIAQEANQELSNLDLLTLEGQHKARLLQDTCLQTIDQWQKRVASLSAHLKAVALHRVQEAQTDLSIQILNQIKERDQEIIDLNAKKMEIDSKLTACQSNGDSIKLQQQLVQLIEDFKVSTNQRIGQIKQLLDHLQVIYQSKHSGLQAVREDIFRAKNAIDLIQKDLHQKKQVSLSLAIDLADQEQISQQLDQELDEQTQKQGHHQAEIADLDQLIAKQEKMLGDQDNEINSMRANLADVQQRKHEEEEAFKLHLMEEQKKRQQRDWYVPEKDNHLDMELADHVNKSPYNVTLKRLKEGMYEYGTKRIYAKTVDQKLLIKLNGGFMLIQEFLDTYAEAESKLQMMQDRVYTGMQSTGALGNLPPGAKSPGRGAKAGSPRATAMRKGVGSPRLGTQKQ